jgi:hypothetical protein
MSKAQRVLAQAGMLGIPGERERDSGMKSERQSGMIRTVIRDEGEHRFRDEAEQF